MALTAELPINTKLLAPLARISQPAKPQEDEKTKVARKMKLAREQGYDVAFPKRRLSDKAVTIGEIIFLALATCLVFGLAYQGWMLYSLHNPLA